MKRLLSILTLSLQAFLLSGAVNVHENDAYIVKVSHTGVITVSSKAGDAEKTFLPDFYYAFSQKAPKVTLDRIPKNGLQDNLNYRAVALNKELDYLGVIGRHKFELEKVDAKPGKVLFVFKRVDEGELRAILDLPEGQSEPRLTYKFKASRNGSYTIGYCGAPSVSPSEADEFWQPLVWTQKRFPARSYLTPDNLCSMPLTAVSDSGCTYGVCVSPESFPFQPMPTQKNFRFGVMLRNADGDAQPMVWAPILGVKESALNIGDTFSISLRLFCQPSSMLDTHRDLALRLFGLQRYRRDNATGSLNTTLDNMIDYGMSKYSWFVDSLKGCSYETDVKGAVKNTSSLNPLEIALVTGREDVYRERFIPMLEFVLSRNNLLFSLKPKAGEGGQKPTSSLGRPVINASEASSLYLATGQQSSFLIDKIQKEKGMKKLSANERYWREQLALYYATGRQEHLENARKAADIYLEENINTVQTLFDYKNQSSSSFWTSLSPKFPELYNMYDATGDRKYLEAAEYAARRYAQFIWMCPAIPRDSVRVNIGSVAPKQKPWGEAMVVPEESVPAWRVSEIGLHCECAATSTSHRGVFPAHYAAYMRRIGEASGNDFLIRIANWAIVGRYSNFPGYHMNTARTTVYEKPDFPLHTHYEMNVNSMHYNHIWPHMSIILDYIISDIEMRSKGRIHFPYTVVEAFANLGCRMYGFEKGEFMGEQAYLWMPQRLVKCSNPQINYICARSADKKTLYLAFSNQGEEDITAEIELDKSLVKTSKPVFSISVPVNGISTAKIDAKWIDTGFQELLLGRSSVWGNDYYADDKVRAMLINPGNAGKEVFAFVSGQKDLYRSVRMQFRANSGNWSEATDNTFPFEFSIPISEDCNSFEFKFTMTDANGSTFEHGPFILNK